jgi:hypothetical protein
VLRNVLGLAEAGKAFALADVVLEQLCEGDDRRRKGEAGYAAGAMNQELL